jgi:hypothetical protein
VIAQRAIVPTVMKGVFVQRVIFSIRPRWEGGFDLYLADNWVGGGVSLDQVRALAQRKADQEASNGNVALVATRNMKGDIVSVQWVDPPREVVSIPELEDVESSSSNAPGADVETT